MPTKYTQSSNAHRADSTFQDAFQRSMAAHPAAANIESVVEGGPAITPSQAFTDVFRQCLPNRPQNAGMSVPFQEDGIPKTFEEQFARQLAFRKAAATATTVVPKAEPAKAGKAKTAADGKVA